MFAIGRLIVRTDGKYVGDPMWISSSMDPSGCTEAGFDKITLQTGKMQHRHLNSLAYIQLILDDFINAIEAKDWIVHSIPK